MFSVIERESGRWVGRLGPWQPEGWPGPEIGWAIVRDCWGKGYAVEGAIAASDWAFDTLGWPNMIHSISPANLPSQRVAQKLGSRNLGRLRRLVLGSVSRAVVRRATCAVLVVKGRPREVQHVLVGLDRSVRSRRAVAFVSRLQPPPGGVVTLLAVVEPVRSTSISRLPPSVRAVLGSELAALETGRRRAARREVEAAARRLTRSGWKVRAEVRGGVPLTELLRAVSASRADVVVLGARGVGGMERLLLGSVAEGALAESPVSVLLVK